MHKRKLNQRGLITMELLILVFLAIVIYFIYKKVQSAQQYY
jgi:preprotein translocase subunit YajC